MAPMSFSVPTGFTYEEPFSRNLRWGTAAEQQALRGKSVAMRDWAALAAQS